ncbi:EAL domain-containing protein [Aliivibrio sp. S3MY1]|uniref:bifunctional diguanylate cyclase/phosphodiesterase n=1 Tax=unclassified Aliivibrio TaxID=2645654 RepID=UPI00237916FF|nr:MULTISPECIES: EAL domain-containing protein [unclassified Aliivibrio]MDD9194805.1 EAL domain-containing protein [Aliivibrio sp. S3MY1]MDD9198654.1 EAL domain-containing protein [Aliivibrio sp. S2MY1]
MLLKSDKKLLTLISVLPTALISLFTLILSTIVIHENEIKKNSVIELLYQDSIIKEKERVKQQVDYIYNQIIVEEKLAEEKIRGVLKERVEESFNALSLIYNQNKYKSNNDIIKLISCILRKTRFNNGRGYFFIYNMEGKNLMHPIKSEIEGKNNIHYTDADGKFLIEDYIQSIKNNGGGFNKWREDNPNQESEYLKKISYIKYFEPLDIFVGSVEYVDNIKKDVQDKLLSWISDIRYGNNGYILILDKSGNILSHYDKDRINTNIYDNDEIIEKEFIDELDERLNNKDSIFSRYLNYFNSVVNNDKTKLSYIRKYDDWDWYISAGVYTKEQKELISSKENILIEKNQQELMQILMVMLILAFSLALLSLTISKYVGRRFTKFQMRISNDFNVLEKTKNKMQHMALHDSLTQLPNRFMLESKIEEEIVKVKKNQKKLALMFVDLDNFKKVNDHYGHDVGDMLLKKISARFTHIIKDNNMVARFGGDEFIFFFSNLNSKEEAEIAVNKIQNIFNDEMIICGKEITTGCSIGIAMYPDDADNFSDLIGKADIALFKLKGGQKGSSLFFDKTINEEVNYQFTLENELRNALDNDEISLVYQPQIEVKTGKIYGVEVLSRWDNKTLGVVSPVQFISVAEETGMIDDIGDFVLKKSCEDIQKVMPNGENAIMLSVNISPKQLIKKDFVERIMNIVCKSGIDISRITLEITENILISDLDAAAPILLALKKLGFGISLDDFGTGYSSLSYLNNLPITEIKIDRSFVNSLFTNNQSETLIKAIIAIGSSCQMTVVAEGAETKEQLDKLKEYKCDLVQGYYLDKPLLIKELQDKYS